MISCIGLWTVDLGKIDSLLGLMLLKMTEWQRFLISVIMCVYEFSETILKTRILDRLCRAHSDLT